MQKKIILFLIFIILLGGGFIGYKYFEKSKSNAVKTAPKQNSIKILIKEGQDIAGVEGKVEGIADVIEKSTNGAIKRKDFLNMMKDKNIIKEKLNNSKYETYKQSEMFAADIRYPLEGYIFPATYTIYYPNEQKAPTLDEVVDQIISGSVTNLVPLFKIMKEKGLNVHETLTLASVVEKEKPAPEKYGEQAPKIAGVFNNRTNSGMKWQSDVTLNYSFNINEIVSSGEKTKIDNPYNSYTRDMIVGPISSPGKITIDSTVTPDKNDYYFFLANPKTSEVFYSKTFVEHEKYRIQHVGDFAY